jgi:hypothetical protein
MGALKSFARLAVAIWIISVSGYATAQTCHIITSSGPCASVNVDIPGVFGIGLATCTTTGVYGDPVGAIIGPIFLTVVASQSCPSSSGVTSVTQRASTAVDLNNTAIDGLRSSVVDDNGRTLFRAHGEEDCAKGFSETIETNDPSACTPVPPPCPPLSADQLLTASDGGSSLDQAGPQGQLTQPPLECDPNDPTSCPCQPINSPIIVDLSGKGFFLTSAGNGVTFDISATGTPIQISWIAGGADNAFLALDRNGNGRIDNGAELFGNFTPQPQSQHPNGFLALAEYDKPENGGNGDGIIDARDAIWPRLRLWIDANHDGVSQPEELHGLEEMGVFNIGLDYSLSMRTDEFGNVFRYRAKINQGIRGETEAGKQIYDVFFVSK